MLIAVEAEGKGKQPEPAKTDLPTPESIPSPDTKRLEADKARRQAEAAKAPSDEASPKKKPEQAVTKASKAKSGKTKPSKTALLKLFKTSTD